MFLCCVDFFGVSFCLFFPGFVVLFLLVLGFGSVLFVCCFVFDCCYRYCLFFVYIINIVGERAVGVVSRQLMV